MSPKEKKEIIENLRTTLIRDWGHCLVDKVVSVDKDDWRYEESEHRTYRSRNCKGTQVKLSNLGIKRRRIFLLE